MLHHVQFGNRSRTVSHVLCQKGKKNGILPPFHSSKFYIILVVLCCLFNASNRHRNGKVPALHMGFRTLKKAVIQIC